jgi:hypothetical protein
MDLTSQQLGTISTVLSLILTYPVYWVTNYIYQIFFLTKSLRILKRENVWKVIGYNELRNEHFVAETAIFDIIVIAIKRFFVLFVIFVLTAFTIFKLLK